MKQKLTSASFQGSSTAACELVMQTQLHTGYAAAREVEYELKYIDSQRDQRLRAAARTNGLT